MIQSTDNHNFGVNLQISNILQIIKHINILLYFASLHIILKGLTYYFHCRSY